MIILERPGRAKRLRLVPPAGPHKAANLKEVHGHTAKPVAILFVLTLALAFATRAWQFGNPVIQVDEQFYLLVGDRMLKGAVPFVDIWDRKPCGIFLLYAAIRLLGGDGIIQYQVVATLFAGMTAFLIGWMALRLAGLRGAVVAAAVYLLWLIIFDGSGGQTPVFYNLPVAAAAALILAGTTPEAGPRKLLLCGSLAMLSMGVALQIKYSVVFEGIFFGLFLLARARALLGAKKALACGAVWVVLALLPTMAAYAWYVRQGEADAFVYANFISIFNRGGWPLGSLVGRLLTLLAMAAPLAICAFAEWRSSPWRSQEGTSAQHARGFALCWLASALVGLLLFGTYFVHYFLPVLVPLSLCCARIFQQRGSSVSVRSGKFEQSAPLIAVVLLLGAGIATGTSLKRLKHRGRAEPVTAFAHLLSRDLRGCLLVFDGDPILYHLTGACIPTKLAFPNHLNEDVEKGSVGLDPAAETRRIFEQAPPDMVVGSDRPDKGYNATTLTLVNRYLARDYHVVGRQKIGSRIRIAYKRNPGAKRPVRGVTA